MLVYLVVAYLKSLPASRPISDIALILAAACASVIPYLLAKRSGVEDTRLSGAVGSSSKLFMTI